ncbi:hypothetical protein GHT06_011546 [Daphnia sinensis]|uniref:Uncharacterized protein n=1 Tax=Daphnia sinensis TaxID=1820382 RepID=A0AAD5PVC8_9CRUS|nr:hypothetical protein GHT06_011546 [Daphnia sinensis]
MFVFFSLSIFLFVRRLCLADEFLWYSNFVAFIVALLLMCLPYVSISARCLGRLPRQTQFDVRIEIERVFSELNPPILDSNSIIPFLRVLRSIRILVRVRAVRPLTCVRWSIMSIKTSLN